MIPNVAGVMTNLTEEHVADKSFELMFALDEVKNALILSSYFRIEIVFLFVFIRFFVHV